VKIAHFLKSYYRTLIIIGVAVLLFEGVTDLTRWLEPVLFPGLTKIVPALFGSTPKLFKGLLSSFGLLLPAYGLAFVLGVSLGLTVGWYEPLRKALVPIFRGLAPVPPTLLIPYAIAVLPTFWLSSAFIILVGSFWPILISTIHGVVLLEDRYLDNARSLGLTGFKLLRKVIFPATLPMIFTGAGMALVFSFMLLTVAEMFGAKSGLGHFIQYYADFSDYPRVLAGMIFMALCIILVMELFDFIQRKVLYWAAKR
jgi:NitT/TauT family transport system permease protein